MTAGRRVWVLFAAAMIALAGCDRAESPAAGNGAAAAPQGVAPDVGAGEEPFELNDPRTAHTADSTWWIAFEPVPAPIPSNEEFALKVLVREGGPDGPPAEGIELSVDAAMPHHGHGMNVVPALEPLGGGRYRVRPLLFHMRGYWQLYFDVTRDGVTERAQFEVDV